MVALRKLSAPQLSADPLGGARTFWGIIVRYFKSTIYCSMFLSQLAYAHGDQGIIAMLTDLFVLAVGISAIFKKGVGGTYRVVVFFGTLFSIWFSWVIVGYTWPNLFSNGPLLTIVYCLFLFPLFLSIYYFADSKLNRGGEKSMFYLLVRHLTRRSS